MSKGGARNGSRARSSGAGEVEQGDGAREKPAARRVEAWASGGEVQGGGGDG